MVDTVVIIMMTSSLWLWQVFKIISVDLNLEPNIEPPIWLGCNPSSLQILEFVS